jgi:hypothetical protein
MDERVHLTLDARKRDVAVCGAAHKDIIRTAYRPDVTCPYCLLADLESMDDRPAGATGGPAGGAVVVGAPCTRNVTRRTRDG